MCYRNYSLGRVINCNILINVSLVTRLWNAVVDKNQNFILYIAVYMHILLYAAIASYLTIAHHCLSLLDHLFNSLYYAILTSYHHFTYSVFYSICSYFNISHIQFSIQYAAILTSLHHFTYSIFS